MPPAAGFAIGFSVMAAYWPGISGAATSPRWAVIAVGASLLLFLCDRVVITVAHVAGFVFIAWCALTLTWSADYLEGIGALLQIAALAAVFALGSVTQSLRSVFAGASAGLAISSVIVIAQWCGLSSDALPSYWDQRPAALFYNANYMGEAAALVIVGCLAYRLRWGALACMPALVLSCCRGAILALVVAGLVWLWSQHLRATMAICIALLLTIVAPVALVTTIGPGSSHRLALWSDTARGITFAGHGLGSFWPEFPKTATQTDMSKERPARAHNELLDVAFETGIVGAVLLLVFAASLIGPLTPERFVLIALAVEAVFAFPLHLPATAFVGVLVAGVASRDRLSLRDAAALGRDRVRRWLAARAERAGVV